jgi:hypothetical protein
LEKVLERLILAISTHLGEVGNESCACRWLAQMIVSSSGVNCLCSFMNRSPGKEEAFKFTALKIDLIISVIPLSGNFELENFKI